MKPFVVLSVGILALATSLHAQSVVETPTATDSVMRAAFAAPTIELETPANPENGTVVTAEISPEPSTFALLLGGAACFVKFGSRKRSI